MENNKLLSIEHLSVWYTKNKPVLKELSLDLYPNEVVGLIGLNGAGKTTLIKTISGLLNTYHLNQATWQGKSLSFRDNSFKMNRYTVFAEDHSFQYFTFQEYVSYVASSYGVKMLNVEELVRGFHFTEYTDVLLKELSTGNLKKAYLITAFALHPCLLLLDEPVNGLDYQSTEYLYELIGRYKEYGTILFSSHILESICLTSSRVLVLEKGQITKQFQGKEIITSNIREVLSGEADNKSNF